TPVAPQNAAFPTYKAPRVRYAHRRGCDLCFSAARGARAVSDARARESEWTTDMRCVACGAEMHLIAVAPDKTMMVPGYEEHTFECSGCHDHVRRLVFTPRAIGPLTSERMRLPPAGLQIQDKGVTAEGASARAVRAGPPIKAIYVFGMLIVIALYQSAEWLTLWGFPNRPRHDSRWQTEGGLPWATLLRCGRTIPPARFADLLSERKTLRRRDGC